MKKLLPLAFVLLAGFTGYAQTTTVKPTKTDSKESNVVKVQTQNPAAYACPKCYKISKGSGQCPDCKVDKVQLGTYYCTKCLKSTGAKPGNCPTCNTATTQITRKYCAKMGGTPLKNKPVAKTDEKAGT